ncbi:hypothetical protein L1887_34207 [Cichorium endivia]|nr:hypothetical protein L1887_34207 [Cichorium endivia]
MGTVMQSLREETGSSDTRIIGFRDGRITGAGAQGRGSKCKLRSPNGPYHRHVCWFSQLMLLGNERRGKRGVPVGGGGRRWNENFVKLKDDAVAKKGRNGEEDEDDGVHPINFNRVLFLSGVKMEPFGIGFAKSLAFGGTLFKSCSRHFCSVVTPSMPLTDASCMVVLAHENNISCIRKDDWSLRCTKVPGTEEICIGGQRFRFIFAPVITT